MLLVLEVRAKVLAEIDGPVILPKFSELLRRAVQHLASSVRKITLCGVDPEFAGYNVKTTLGRPTGFR